jgi:hypothetical protein
MFLKRHTAAADMNEENVRTKRDHMKESLKEIHRTQNV